MEYERTAVIVIGDGLVGLCAAALLADRGVPVSVLSGANHPHGSGHLRRPRRADAHRELSPRTVEVLRTIGIRTCAEPADREGWVSVDCGRITRVVRARAVAAGARIRRHSPLAIDADARRVTVTAGDSRTGIRLHGRFLLATDSGWRPGAGPPAVTGAWPSPVYRSGGVFLAGEAACGIPTSHLGPSTDPGPGTGTGLQLDIGIQDVHNLAWKLTAVLREHAGTGLLDTYDAERRPVAVRAYDRMRHGWRDLDTAVGYRYESDAVLCGSDPAAGPVLAPADLTGQAGTRAPHLALRHNGRDVCALELFGPAFTMLAGPDAGDWSEAGKRAAKLLDVPIDVYRIGADVLDGRAAWDATYGVGPAGASLIRPDGFVGWRAARADGRPDRAMEDVLARLLCRQPSGDRSRQ